MNGDIETDSPAEEVITPERHSLIMNDGEPEDDTDDQEPRESKTFTFPLVLVTIACVIGSPFQFGYNLGVINAPEEAIRAYFNEKTGNFGEMHWATTVAVFAAGGLIGSSTGPLIADRFGRNRTLLLNNLIGIVAGILMGLSYLAASPVMLILGRIVVGINAGCHTVVAPCYLTEVSPTKVRGSLGTLNQLGINIGILMSQILGIPQIFGTKSLWPFLLGFTIIPAIFQLCVLPFCAKSPKFLYISKNDKEGAIKALQRLRGRQDVDLDMQSLERERKDQLRRKSSIKDLFTTKSFRMPLLISIMMQMVNQFTGINAVVGYSTAIFRSAGVQNSTAATCGVGAIAVVMTLLTVKLIEIKGRRTLLLWGLFGMGVFYIIITISLSLQRNYGIEWTKYISVICVLAVMSIYQFGPGPIPWFIVAELFSQDSRGAAMSVSGFTNWLSTFVILFGYPPLDQAIGPFAFLVFLVIVILLLLFTYRYVPETKGRTIRDIAGSFRIHRQGSQMHKHTDDTELEMDIRIPKSPPQKKPHLTASFLFAVICCFIGSSFQFGYNLAVINSPRKVVVTFFNTNGVNFGNIHWALTVSLFAIGGLIGAMISPFLANRIGRKFTLLINTVIAIGGGLLMGGAYYRKSPAMLIIGRIFVGLNAGANAVVAPWYLTEIAPIGVRGHLSILHQLGVNVGILCSQILGIPQVLGSLKLWPFLIGFAVAPAVLQLFILPFCPKSPKFLLVIRKNRGEAIKALERLRHSDENVEKELDFVMALQAKQSNEKQYTVKDLFVTKSMRSTVFISIILMLANQLTGINVILGYSTSIFTFAGIRNSEAVTCGVGVVAIAMYLVTVYLIQAKARRSPLIIGLFGMGVCYILMIVALLLQHRYNMQWAKYLTATCVLAIMGAYLIGPGPLPWTIVAELFKHGSRGASSSVSIFVYWFAGFLVFLGYPLIEASIHAHTFTVFVVLVALLLVFIFLKVPETKGNMFQDIKMDVNSALKTEFDQPLEGDGENGDIPLSDTTALAT